MTYYAEDFVEGEKCPMDGPPCSGVLVFPPVENCSCHICPPCRACTDLTLVCSVCGWEVEDLDT